MLLRLFGAVCIGCVVSVVLGRFLLPLLRRLKAGQAIKEDGPTWHMSKQGTPTMGGLMFIGATALAFAAVSWQELLAGELGGLFVFGFALVFGVIGFVDDFAKVKKKVNTGLSAGQKFVLQLAAAILFVVLLRSTGHLSPSLYIPFFDVTFQLPWIVYMIFAALVIVGTVNAVNITDGVDGLAAGVTLPVCAFFAAAGAYGWFFWGREALGGLALLSAALFGALVGFLFYNFHPARIFMGDTGSLFLGGVVCGLAFAFDIPLILILVGVIYILETLSDIIQVAYFKATGGKRIFKMAPVHHHLEMCGWSEVKLFFVFSGITLLFCLLAFWGFAGRYPPLG